MGTPFTLLADSPVLLLAVLLALGAAVGHVRVLGVRLGPSAVLFAALAVSAWAAATGVDLEVPEVIGTFGLVLFTYTVGVVAGTHFFASLRRGWPTLLLVAVGLAVLGGIAVLGGRLLGLGLDTVAGAYAGALTNTPALAAASARAADPAAPTVGYSITYLGGVVVMLFAAAWALRRPGALPRRAEIGHVTVRVEVDEPLTVAALAAEHHGRVGVSRLKHAHAVAPTVVPAGDEVIGRNDLVTVVGPRDLLDAVASRLGHVSSHDIVADRRDLDFRRVTLSSKPLVGHTVGELDLGGRFGATVSRVRRGDVDLVAHDTFVLAMGDRLRVIAPRARMAEVGRYLGDSDRGLSDINVGGLALGLAVGLLLGLVHVPTPGGGFTVGSAAGTLLAGLVFGRLGRVGPVITSMSHGAAQSLSALGMVTFLAYAGVRAGRSIADALSSDVGWRVAVLGVLLTASAAAGLLLALRVLRKASWLEVAGSVAGAQTQPAILAYVEDRTGYDTRVGVAYALVYPVAIITKIVVAQVLAGL
ncbi:TrkA C-terminal domain-containing protein [Phycicoccus sp.]|uniref:aspartate-alanine antiporter-like transporter n=1 Tax=Phycicoccus sp. TaxID=1902410 RepID=UPI002BD703BB|nr:TrkA C-terminal domain-containing protein [Phycicoccus sp.]HMM96320.1 TrkA C-terminal domain-containing protein [Phycicoccus sp.]